MLLLSSCQCTNTAPPLDKWDKFVTYQSDKLIVKTFFVSFNWLLIKKYILLISNQQILEGQLVSLSFSLLQYR